jgi:cyclophilin family peptidyl-prolyl cis-trans isomerase
MSRTWMNWLARWKSSIAPNRRPLRRPQPIRLRAEMLETRVTPAVIYGMNLGQSGGGSTGGGGGGGPVQTIDTVPPVLTVTSTTPSSVSTNTTITGTLTDNIPAGTSLVVKVDKTGFMPVTLTNGTFSFTTTYATDGSANGPHTLAFFGRDAQGNASNEVDVSFTLAAGAQLNVDLDASSDTGTTGNHTTTLDTVTLSGHGPASTLITLTQTGDTTTSAADGSFSFTNVHLNTGANTFTVTATSNGTPLTFTRTVIRDTTPTVAAPVTNFSVTPGSASTVMNLPQIFSDADVNSLIQFITNRGTVDIELFDQQVAATVANFLKYVNGTTTNGGDLINSIFHRKTTTTDSGINVLQGGGFTFSGPPGTLTPIATDDPIALQALLSNLAGTIAMARTDNANTATSQFFINTTDNTVLNPDGQPDNPNNPNSGDGYAVFGVIRSGIDAINAAYATPAQDRDTAASNTDDAFGQIPLINYPSPPAGNFPTDTTASNYEIITGASVVRQPDPHAPDALNFAVSANTNPSLVTATIANGKLTLSYASGQTGSATLTLTATDTDGASVQTQFTVTVGQDTAPPTVTINSPASGQTVSSNPTITGTVTDNFAVATLNVSVDGGAISPVTFDGTGHFTFTPSVATDGSEEGLHHVTFTAQDPTGNNALPNTFSFTLDTIAPTIAINSPADGQTFAADPTITGTVTDADGVQALQASVDGGAAQAVTFDSSGNFSFNAATGTNGQHTVTFTSQDLAGNQATTATLTYTVAQTAAVTITSPGDGQSFTADPTIGGTVDPGVLPGTLTASVDSGAAQTVIFDPVSHVFSFSPATGTEGQHSVEFSAGAQFGSVTLTYKVDTTPPTVTVTSPPNNQVIATNPQITGTATDNQTVAGLTANVDNNAAVPVTVDSTGHFTFTTGLATDGSADGSHSVSFTAVDAAGNASTVVSVSFLLDTVGPSVVISAPASGNVLQMSPTITGTATDTNAVAQLTVSINGGAAQAVTLDPSGNFSFNPNLATDGSADGQYLYHFVATDTAGNITTADDNLYLDTTPPVATITSPADNQVFATNPTINVAVTDNIGSGSADVFIGGVFSQQVFFAANTGFSFTPNFATDGSANGPHTITFVALDAATNASTPADFHFTLSAP